SKVFALDHRGEVQEWFKLPGSCGVDALASNGECVFAANGGGGIYALADGRPRLARPYMQVKSLAFSDGILVVSRHDGCYGIGPDNRVLWRNRTQRCGGCVCCDRLRAYYLRGNRLVAYHVETGEEIWESRLNGSGRTLWQTENRVYADSGAGGQIHC